MNVSVVSRERLSKMLSDALGGRPQRELAKQIGVTQPMISSWLSCKTWPETENLEKIAHWAGYTMDELMAYLDGKDRNPRSVTVARVVRHIEAMPPYEILQVINAASSCLAERLKAAEPSARYAVK